MSGLGPGVAIPHRSSSLDTGKASCVTPRHIVAMDLGAGSSHRAIGPLQILRYYVMKHKLSGPEGLAWRSVFVLCDSLMAPNREKQPSCLQKKTRIKPPRSALSQKQSTQEASSVCVMERVCDKEDLPLLCAFLKHTREKETGLTGEARRGLDAACMSYLYDGVSAPFFWKHETV